MKEKWIQICQIQGFEEVREWYWLSNSNEDKIINRNTGKRLKGSFDNKGYKKINLRTIGGKMRTYRIHILKAKAFFYTPNPLGADIVRHLDDCKTNNILTNLTWGSYSENIQDSMRNGCYNYEAAAKGSTMGAKKVSKLIKCIETGIIYSSTREIERLIGISHINISLCCRGKQQTAGGYHWEFVNKGGE